MSWDKNTVVEECLQDWPAEKMLSGPVPYAMVSGAGLNDQYNDNRWDLGFYFLSYCQDGEGGVYAEVMRRSPDCDFDDIVAVERFCPGQAIAYDWEPFDENYHATAPAPLLAQPKPLDLWILSDPDGGFWPHAFGSESAALETLGEWRRLEAGRRAGQGGLLWPKAEAHGFGADFLAGRLQRCKIASDPRPAIEAHAFRARLEKDLRGVNCGGRLPGL